MSQLRSEEIFNPENIDSSEICNPSAENSTSGSSVQGKSEDCPISCSSSSSPSLSSGSDCTRPYNTAFVSSGSGSVVDDTDDISSSFSSSQYNVVNASSTSGGSSVIRNSSSWKSVTTGSEESASDVSCSNLSTSGSEADNHSNPTKEHQKLNTFDCEKDKDQCSSDGFETENSEGESTSAAVRTFRQFVSQGGLGKVPRGQRGGRRILIHAQSHYNRLQSEGTNNSIFRSNQDQRQEARNPNRRINILRRVDNFIVRMSTRVARYHKELCIVFLILASGIASLRSASPKIRATSVPSPFFEEKDAPYFLQDNYMGEYVELANKQIPYHPSFLFYYAPWDSESVASKSVFLGVAKHFFFTYHGRVKFYAINCWWPAGQCRKNYKNLSHYPIFVAHIGKAAGIIYNGPIRLEPMVKFINSLLKPVTRIDTEEELWHFRAQHDVIMLGYFNFTTDEATEAYETYLQMALRTFEADPFNQVGFGLFLRPELAEKFFLTSSNAISLVLFNEIHTAKWHGGYHGQGLKGPVSQVAEWIIERTKSVPLTWVYALRNGFANRPVSLGPHDFAQQLTKGPVFLLVTRRYFPSGHSPFYMQAKEIALDYFNCNRSGNVTKLRRTAHKVNAEWASIWSSVVQICQRKGSFQCQQLLPNIHHWQKKRALFKREPLQHYENISTSINFTGLSCTSERQFKFLAIDPVDVPYFVELGLSGLTSTDGSSRDFYVDPMAFIIDSQNDIIVPLSSLNISDVAIAIHNYTTIVESGEMDKISSRLFLNNNGKLNNKDVSDNTLTEIKPKNIKNNLQSWGSSDLIRYVNGNMQHNNSVLLIYTASFCGYCAIAVTHFVALSRFISENYGTGNMKVTLAKIDMFKNSLPAELSPERLPTVVFIPNWNRSDIRLYPEKQDITAVGLLRFVLSELDPSIRVKASLMTPYCGRNTGQCSRSSRCTDSSSTASIWTQRNATVGERQSCIKSSRSSVSSQIELLLERLQNGEEAMFSPSKEISAMTTQTWNGQLLDRLRTLAVTLDVS